MDSSDDLTLKLLKGDFTHLPKDRSQVVRIFLSSTFTDTHEERDYLIQNVFPRLREYSKTAYGLDFQVIDMRWGIPNEASNNHTTTAICIREVKNCQRLSIGPNFVALVSHRYGTRMLPNRIVANEFEIFFQEISECPSDYDDLLKYDGVTLNTLEYCYKKDENEIPNRYRLLNIDEILPNKNIKENSNAWDKLQSKLSALFRKLADACYCKGKFTLEQRQRYFVSVTEKEIINGILNANELEDNALVFFRDIDDLEMPEAINADKVLARRFIDLDKDGNIDVESRELLNNLKKRICEKLPESNIHRFSGLKWSADGGITRKHHAQYMKQFGETFYESVKKLIDRNAKKSYYLESVDKKNQGLLQEVLDHAKFSIECVEKFHGRSDLLDSLKNYILDSSNHRALYIYGESGCGKTSVIAKFANELRNLVPDPHNWIILLRFMGTTPGTSNIMNVFKSIIHQISLIYKISMIPSFKSAIDMKNWLLEVFKILGLKRFNRKIVVFLDSIDQLSTHDYSLEWLIDDLPDNVKIVYSTLPSHGDILHRLEKIETNTSQFVKVEQLNSAIVKTIIEDWLLKNKRRLSETQWEILNNSFSVATLYPLYVKLIFDVILKWTSYYVPDEVFKRSLSIDECIKYLFQLFEREHGKVLFSRLMCYFTTFKNGISESELEDIMSIDDDVLFEVFEFHEPPVRRFPVALWARIKDDLREYMVEKEIDDTRVIYWYHRRFIEVANSYYISKLNSTQREIVFGNVVDFFNETWKNKPKPFKYNDYLKKKKKLDTNQAEATRDTAMQKTIYTTDDGLIRFNKRKLSELPSFIGQLTANLALPLFCEHVAFNYDFFYGQLTCLLYSEILGPMESMSSSSSYNVSEEAKNANLEIKIIQMIYLQCLLSLCDYPDSCAVQILSRILAFYGHSKHITQFIDQCDEKSYKNCNLVAPYQMLPEPGAGEIFSLDKHTKGIKNVCMGGENDAFVFSMSDKIHSFDLSTIASLGEYPLPKLESDLDEYKELIVYFEENISSDKGIMLKDIKGFFITISNHILHVADFSNTIYLSKKFDYEISQIIQITDKHFLLSFKNKSFIEIYNVKETTPLLVKELNQPIRFILHKLRNQTIHFRQDFCDSVSLTICLDQSEIQLYDLKVDDNSVSFELDRKLASSGVECVSGFIDKNVCMLSYADGSFGIWSQSSQGVSENDLVLFKAKDLTTIAKQFKILDIHDIDESILLLGDDSHLYMKINEMFCTIKGPYQQARLNQSKFEQLLAINMGTIDIYHKQVKDNNLSVVRINQVNAHFNEITFMFIKDDMLLTTSLDSTLKVSFLSKSTPIDEQITSFDTTSYDIEKLVEVNSLKMASFNHANGKIDYWNLENGKILERNDTKFEHIYDLSQQKDICVIVGIKNILNIKQIVLKIFRNNQEAFTYLLDECLSARIFYNKKQSTFVVIGKTHMNIIKVYLVNYSSKWSMKFFELKEIHVSDDILDNVCLTSEQSLELVIFQKNEFIFMDLVKNEISKRKVMISINHTSLIPNKAGLKSTSFYPIDQTNCVLALNYLNQIIIIQKEQDLIILNDSEFKITHLTTHENTICALNELKNEILVYKLDKLIDSKSLNCHQSKIDLKTNKLLHMSVNSRYLALICSPKLLCVYQLNNGKQVAMFPIYCEAKSLHLTNEYVSLGLVNRRVISYLIVNESNHEKIKKLESRQVDKSKRKKVEKILQSIGAMMDQSSDEDCFENDEIFDDKEPNADDMNEYNLKRLKQLRKSKQQLQVIGLEKTLHSTNTLAENWLHTQNYSKDCVKPSGSVDELVETNKNEIKEMIENEKKHLKNYVDKHFTFKNSKINTSQACSLM